MNERIQIEPPDLDRSGYRRVPVLCDHDVGHYPEFRDFFVRTFDLDVDPLRFPGLLSVDRRLYELVFTGRSGQPFPAGVEINVLVAGLEPLDQEQCDADVWHILRWLVAGVGGPWSVQELEETGRIYRIPAALGDAD